MAKDLTSAIAELRKRQNDLAHGTMTSPPQSLHEIFRLCGEYNALTLAIAKLQEISRQPDDEE